MNIAFWACMLIGIIPSAFGQEIKVKEATPEDLKKIEVIKSFPTLSAEKKEQVLDKLLADGFYVGFLGYVVLFSEEEKNAQIFEKVILKNGSLDLLLSIGEFTKDRMNIALTIANSKGLVNEENKQEFIHNSIEETYKSISPIKSSLKILAQAKSKALVDVLYNYSLKTKIAISKEEAVGALYALALLGEDGFQLILDRVKSEKDKAFALSFVKDFNADAVIPALKLYENPRSTEFQRDLAVIMIQNFPKDYSPIIDKFVEACVHGRYYKTGRINVADSGQVQKIVSTNWKTLITEKLAGNLDVLNYIAKKHLPNAKNEALAKIIYMLCDIDFKEACKYFKDVDPKNFSKESIDALLYSLVPDSLLKEGQVDPNEDLKLATFSEVFFKFDPDLRFTHLEGAKRFTHKKLADFYIKKYRSFSENEQVIVLLHCGMYSGIGKKFPEALRDKVFNSILKTSTEKAEKDLIETLLKKSKK